MPFMGLDKSSFKISLLIVLPVIGPWLNTIINPATISGDVLSIIEK